MNLSERQQQNIISILKTVRSMSSKNNSSSAIKTTSLECKPIFLKLFLMMNNKPHLEFHSNTTDVLYAEDRQGYLEKK